MGKAHEEHLKTQGREAIGYAETAGKIVNI
jgi:hypothetical protein